MSFNNKKNTSIINDYNLISNLLLNMLYFKKIKTISSGISYKNRFLIKKRSSKFQFIGLLMNKGFKLKMLKTINTCYLNFLHKFHELNLHNFYDTFFLFKNLNMGEFINLYNSFTLFKDWSRALIWRLDENLPLIKVISKKQKKKKTKKKKKKRKFVLEYKYIKNKARFQVALRWLSLLIKTKSNKINVGLLSIFIPFIINPKETTYVVLKKKIYTNILLTL